MSAAAVTVRDATPADWPAMWPFMARIVAAGETFSWDHDTSGEDALRAWMPGPPTRRTFVAVDAGATVLGTAVTGRNHGGGAAHIATASFMVDPAHTGRGVGRALGEAVFAHARATGFRGMQFNAVVETNVAAVALWRSLGMEVVATIPKGFRHPVHGDVGLHIMYRALSG
jgi:L-amino acid N-acyltransferase YncA